MTEYYVGLELVVGGAVDEGDVVLFFIGQHIGTGSEVLGRPAWHFDRVCDLTGRLATGHQVLVGLTRHLWHCSAPWLCSHYSTTQGGVNVGPSVMIRLRLHLTPSGGG
jgi:hypothetical protein